MLPQIQTALRPSAAPLKLLGELVCVTWFDLQNIKTMNAIRPFIAPPDINFHLVSPDSFTCVLMSSIICVGIPLATGFGRLLI